MWASVVNTRFARSNLSTGANSRYKYLSVSAKKKLCIESFQLAAICSVVCGPRKCQRGEETAEMLVKKFQFALEPGFAPAGGVGGVARAGGCAAPASANPAMQTWVREVRRRLQARDRANSPSV